MSLKITNLRLQSHFPGAIELIGSLHAWLVMMDFLLMVAATRTACCQYRAALWTHNTVPMHLGELRGIYCEDLEKTRSCDNYSTGFWPPGSLHTLGADGHIWQRDRLFMWIKNFCFEYICGECLQLSLHLMLQIWWKSLLWNMCQ